MVEHAAEAPRNAADPLRVLPRHGQLQRRPQGILGHLLLRHQRAGRLCVGLGGPGHPPARSRRVRAQSGRKTFLAYGGWWEDKTGVRNDNNFYNNGLVGADRTPHPGLWAIKYVYRYLHAAPRGPRRGPHPGEELVRLHQRQGRGRRLLGGEGGRQTVASGRLPELDIAPRQEKEYTLALPELRPEPGVEYWLNLSFVTRADTAWAPKGHEIAWEQLKLPLRRRRAPADASNAPLDMTEQAGQVRFGGTDFSAASSTKRPAPSPSYHYKGVKLLDARPRARLLARAHRQRQRRLESPPARALSENLATNHHDLAQRRPAGKSRDVEVRRIDERSARITVRGVLPRGRAPLHHDLHGLRHAATSRSSPPTSPARRKLAMMPRFGTELVAGAGAGEHHLVRPRPRRDPHRPRSSSASAFTHSTVDAEWVDYSRPQENGNKTDVRWVTLTNAAGHRAAGGRATPPLSVGATALHQGRHGASRLHLPDAAATRRSF